MARGFKSKPCDYVIIQASSSPILWHPWMKASTTDGETPPASQLLVAVGVGGASKHVAVVRPRFSGGVGQTAAQKCHGFWGHGIWGFLGRKKKNAWKKTFGVYKFLRIIRSSYYTQWYDVIWSIACHLLTKCHCYTTLHFQKSFLQLLDLLHTSRGLLVHNFLLFCSFTWSATRWN